MQIAEFVSKETVLNAIREMPETELSIEAIFDRLVYLYKIEAGLAQSRRGEGITIEQLRENKQSWQGQRSF